MHQQPPAWPACRGAAARQPDQARTLLHRDTSIGQRRLPGARAAARAAAHAPLAPAAPAAAPGARAGRCRGAGVPARPCATPGARPPAPAMASQARGARLRLPGPRPALPPSAPQGCQTDVALARSLLRCGQHHSALFWCQRQVNYPHSRNCCSLPRLHLKQVQERTQSGVARGLTLRRQGRCMATSLPATCCSPGGAPVARAGCWAWAACEPRRAPCRMQGLACSASVRLLGYSDAAARSPCTEPACVFASNGERALWG